MQLRVLACSCMYHAHSVRVGMSLWPCTVMMLCLVDVFHHGNDSFSDCHSIELSSLSQVTVTSTTWVASTMHGRTLKQQVKAFDLLLVEEQSGVKAALNMLTEAHCYNWLVCFEVSSAVLCAVCAAHAGSIAANVLVSAAELVGDHVC